MAVQPQSANSSAEPESDRVLTPSLAGGGLIASILATSCCLLPLALVSIGVGGSWMSSLTSLSPYQPLFLAVSVAAIGTGLWRAYRKPKECAPGTLCKVPAVTRTTKAVLWLATCVALSAMLSNSVLPYLV
jgi:mercuric ion transport protein